MAKISFSQRFISDVAAIRSAKKRDELRRRLDLVQEVPGIGSVLVAESLRQEFGGSVRKLVVDPFIVVYEYLEASDEVRVYALIHQRSVH